MSAKLLLVEDNELNRDMLSRRLRKKGYEVMLAVDGQEAIHAARAERPELILMDMSLPEVDGWEATRILKADEATSAIPIVALTAHAMSGARERALDAGCDEYEPKPVDLPALIAKVEVLLERGHQVLDLETMREVAGDCGWSFAELADRLRGEVRAGLEKMAGAVAAGDAELSARLAHGLVGSTATCGATGLAGTFREMEDAAEAEDLSAVARLLDEAVNGFAELEQKLG